MDNKELIRMLNRDLADEHAAVLRYIVHGYQEGEDIPTGASLLSRAREKMWHMHWLGMIIGQLGGEPDMKPAPYPFDPANCSTMFKSYIDSLLSKIIYKYQYGHYNFKQLLLKVDLFQIQVIFLLICSVQDNEEEADIGQRPVVWAIRRMDCRSIPISCGK